MSQRIFAGMLVNEALAVAVKILRDAGVPDAARDARRLMAFALKVPNDRITLLAHEPVTGEAVGLFDAAISLRRRRVPVSHITGTREFYGRNFSVSRSALDPRPDTESLIEIALKSPYKRVLDLGTGTGCILITLLCERPDATGVGTDISSMARFRAEINAEDLGVADRAEVLISNWFAPVNGQGGVTGKFDLIVANPPYIALAEMDGLEPELAREPRIALTDQGDGLGAYRAIAVGVTDFLVPGGRVLLEIGPTQAQAVSQMLTEAGFAGVQTLRDLDGRDRVIQARWPG